MTSPIKPPGGPKPPADPSKAAEGADPKAAEGFREALGTEGAQGAEGAGPSGVESVVADLRAGRIDAQTAVERLVAQTLEGPMASMLDAAGRAELEAHIRATLEDDPSLQALMRDMDR